MSDEEPINMNLGEMRKLFETVANNAAAQIIAESNALVLETFAKSMLTANITATSAEARIGAEMAVKQMAKSAMNVAQSLREKAREAK